MKKIIVSAMAVLAATVSFGQITLEHTYGNTSDTVGILSYTRLSTGYKYWTLKSYYGSGRILKVYNLDHSLYKQINDVPDGYILFVSDKLFDTDTGLEFMCEEEYGENTKIIDEDGSILFDANQGFEIDDYFPDRPTYPILNTPNGTKMLLQGNLSDGKSYVYSLPGTLPTALVTPNENKYDVNLYPNPASDYIKINYSLPANVKIAQVDVYDMNGKVVKTYKVDNAFNDILIDTNSLSSGTYVCRIYSKEQTLSETKFVVTK